MPKRKVRQSWKLSVLGMGKSSTNATVILCFPFALQAGICMLLDRWIVMVLALWKLSCILIILLLGFQLSSAPPKKTKLSPPRASRINQSRISVGLGFWKWPHSLRWIAAGSFSLPTKGGWRHVLHCASICSYLRRWMATFTRYIREDMGRVCGNWVSRWEISVH